MENNFNFPFRCSYKPTSSLPILPNISTNKNVDVDQELINLASKGLKEKFKEYVFKQNSDQENTATDGQNNEFEDVNKKNNL